MERTKIITAVVIAMIFAIIVFQNTAPVETHIFFVTITMPRAALLLLTFFTGLVVGLLIAMPSRRGRK
jgi:uncharacterized integral membrane protein